MQRPLARWLVIITVFALPMHAQIITTVSGTNPVFPPSLAALTAPLGATTGVALDGFGNIYVTDTGNNLVFRISSNGSLTVIAGNGTSGFSGDGGSATHASLNAPTGIT